MDVAQVLHMNGGTGETSYANNSLLQKKLLSLTKPIREEAISSFYRKKLPRSLAIADLGCSSGPNSLFVTCELIELVEKLSMVLTLSGRSIRDQSSHECCYIWELLTKALNDMVYEGIIKEDQIDSFNVPIYYPSPTELELEIEKDGSFTLNHLEVFEVSWKTSCGEELNDKSDGYKVAQLIRAAIEPMLVSHFGYDIIDDIFLRYQHILADRICPWKQMRFSFSPYL